MPISVVEPEPEPEPQEPQLFALAKPDLVPPGSNIKCNTKVKNSKIRGQIAGKQRLAFSIKKVRFCTNILLLKKLF
jgi:hypothetical protein